MKRVITFLILICLVFLPFTVSAKEPTDKFLSKIEIMEDGSIKVSELIKLNGEFNGMFREVNYKNSSANPFSGSFSDLEGNSTLYDGSSIRNLKVGSLSDDGSLSFDDFNRSINYFDEVNYASSSESHKYTSDFRYNGVYLKLFNKSSNDELFYIEYIINDVVVIHNDIAEFAFNTLGNGYTENIGNYQVKVLLPGEDDDYRVWLHGPLNGNIDRVNNKEALGTYNFLGAYNAVSVRLIFNKELVPLATKFSGLTAKSEIINIQTHLADEANREREAIRRQNMIVTIINVIWAIISIVLVIVVVFKSKNSKKTSFEMEYFRDFPASYGPEVLEYLLNKNITEKSLSASILNLIYKKVLSVSKIEDSKKEDYKLVLQEYDETSLTESERLALKLIINEVGNSKEVVLSAIKKHCSKLSNAESFMETYNQFIKESRSLGKSENFYTRIPSIVVASILITLLGVLFTVISFAYELILLGIIDVFLVIILIGLTLSRRFFTKKGADDFAKWQAHKKFLEDFSRFDEKELPEVVLWDKYLVYATVLGCADKLSKEMKIKIDAMNANGTYVDYAPMYHHYYLSRGIYSSIDKGVHQAVSSSRSSIAASSSSSGGGFGGGSIGGGGSFGGGGGGGRF